MRTALFALLLALATSPAAAQLASPGRLSRAHSALEGMRSCTRCHELRREGVAAARCLECHSPLASRIRAGRGYHGRLEDRACSRCHKEHIGVDADIVRFDSAGFRHDLTGWKLRGAHMQLRCRECHRPEHVTSPDVRAYAPSAAFLAGTYLGTATACIGCHRQDSPHEPELAARGCEECHLESEWRELRRFDHDRTDYPLTGAHVLVPCADCHGRGDTLRLTRLPHARCADCHTDPHDGRFGSACSECHQTAGWSRVPAAAVRARFDHARTAFPLRGAHARVTCNACHERNATRRRNISISFAGPAGATFPRPVYRNCGSCHSDFHEGQVRREPGACGRCHGEDAWLPVRFDARRHERETRFPLTASHLAVPCRECHVRTAAASPPRLHWTDLDCRACHARRDPHGSMFAGRPCADCHGNGQFRGVRFDHAAAPRGGCRSCHQDEDPHAGQFGERSCDECHATATYRIASFDHSHKRFRLDGAHARVPCAACHRRDAAGVVRYRPLDTRCAACHGGRP